MPPRVCGFPGYERMVWAVPSQRECWLLFCAWLSYHPTVVQVPSSWNAGPLFGADHYDSWAFAVPAERFFWL